MNRASCVWLTSSAWWKQRDTTDSLGAPMVRNSRDMRMGAWCYAPPAGLFQPDSHLREALCSPLTVLGRHASSCSSFLCCARIRLPVCARPRFQASQKAAAADETDSSATSASAPGFLDVYGQCEARGGADANVQQVLGAQLGLLAGGGGCAAGAYRCAVIEGFLVEHRAQAAVHGSCFVRLDARWCGRCDVAGRTRVGR